MKRPALAVALCLVSSSALLYLAGLKAAVPFAVILFVFGAAVAAFGKHSAGGMFAVSTLILAAMLCLIMTAGAYIRMTRAQSLEGSTCAVSARIIEEPEEHGSYISYKVKTENGETVPSGAALKIYVGYSENTDLFKVGDIITFDGTFSPLDNEVRRYNYSDGIFVSCFAKGIEKTGHRYTPYETCVSLRKAIRENIRDSLTGDDAALSCGMVLGDTSGMSDRLRYEFKICGVSHIVAISGLHISIMCSAVMSMLTVFIKRRKARFISLAAVVLAVAVTGFTPSAVRAGIMCASVFFASSAKKCRDPLNSLGIAVACMLVYDPFYALDVGFELSCCATAGVVVTHDLTAKIIDEKVTVKNYIISDALKSILSVAAQSVGAAVFTLPVMAVSLGYISLVSPLANIAINFAVGGLLILLLIAAAVSFLPFGNILCVPFFAFAKLFTGYIAAAVGFISKIPMSYIPVGGSTALLVCGLSLIFVGAWLLLRKIGGVKTVSLLIAALTVSGIFSYNCSLKDTLQVTALDAGSGFCSVIRLNGVAVMIGCGDDKSDSYSVTSFLKTASVSSIDLLILPEGNVYSGGSDAVLSNVNVKNIALPDGSAAGGYKTDKGTAVSVFSSGEMFSEGKKLDFCFVGDDKVELIFGSKRFVFGANADVLPGNTYMAVALSPPDDEFDGTYISPVFYRPVRPNSFSAVAEGGTVTVSIKEGKEPVYHVAGHEKIS